MQTYFMYVRSREEIASSRLSMLTCVGIEAGGLTGVQSFDGDPVAKFERGKFLMQVDVASFARGPVKTSEALLPFLKCSG